jgi:hypothetical protein
MHTENTYIYKLVRGKISKGCLEEGFTCLSFKTSLFSSSSCGNQNVEKCISIQRAPFQEKNRELGFIDFI